MPRHKYKAIDVEIPNFYICRTTTSKDFINETSGKIKDESLYELDFEIFDYSTNLIGNFQLKHNFITLVGANKKYFYSYWDKTEKVKVPKFNKDYIFEKEKGVFYLRIGDIHNVVKCPYSKLKNNDGELVANVIHTPTRSNYWHFSIRWKDKDDQYINSNKATWKFLLQNTLRAAISEYILVSQPNITKIPKTIYLKK